MKKRILLSMFLALALSLSFVMPLAAEEPTPPAVEEPIPPVVEEPTPPAAEEPIPDAPASTINPTIRELLENTDTNAILRNCLGDEIVDNPLLTMSYGMDLPTIGTMSQGAITDEMIACVREGLDALASSEEPTPPAAPAFTINSRIGELAENPDTNAILRECLGDEIVDNPLLTMSYGLTLPTIAPMSQGAITDEMIACVKAGLEALGPGEEPIPPAPVVTTNSTMRELVENPDTNAILRKCLGDEIVDNPLLTTAYGMDLSTIGPMSQGAITDEMIACVKAGLEYLASSMEKPKPAAPAFTIYSRMGKLVENPDTNAILRKCLGDEIVDNPLLRMAYGLPLPTIAPMSRGAITDEMIACVKEGLEALASSEELAPPAEEEVTPPPAEEEVAPPAEEEVMPPAEEEIAPPAEEATPLPTPTPTSATPIAVTYPSGGESWLIGTNQTITWTSNGIKEVRIELSRNGGKTWGMITPPFTPDGNSRVWEVTGPPTTQARIRVVKNMDPKVYNVCEANFTITRGVESTPTPALPIAVTSPNGGEKWIIGTNQTITWTTSADFTSSVKIQLSRDGGNTWGTIIAYTRNDGSRAWKVTGPPTTQARIRVVRVYDRLVFDVSEANFTITRS